MNVENYKMILAKRISLHPEDDYNTDICCQEELQILTKDIKSSISYILNDMTSEEFIYLSEIYEELFDATDYNEELINAIYTTCEKYKEVSDKYYIKSNLDYILDINKR